jgi:hypothetical protein
MRSDRDKKLTPADLRLADRAILLTAARIRYLRENYPKIAADLEDIAQEDWE